MTRRLAPAVLVLVLALVVGLPALAWAQEVEPSPAGISDLGGGLGILSAGVVVLREIAARLRTSDERAAAKELEVEEEKKAEAWRRDLAAMDARHMALSDRHNSLDKVVSRLEERLVAQAKQGEQLHADLQGIGSKLDAIRRELPRGA